MLNTATTAGRPLIASTWRQSKYLRRYTFHNSNRFFSRGALPGGFTKEGLEQFAIRHWEEGQGDTRASRRLRRAAANVDEHENENNFKIYTDLFSQKISFECREWLDEHHDPSAALGNAYFGSMAFLPERILMTPVMAFAQRQLTLPSSFHVNDQFLAWDVISKAPVELICESKNRIANDDSGINSNSNSNSDRKVKGLTMMAFDAPLNRVYHGNCLRVNVNSNIELVEKLIPYHESFAKFLLGGMVNELEKQASQSQV